MTASSKDIKTRASQLLDAVLKKFYSREVWDNRSLQTMIDEELAGYNDDVAKALDDELHKILSSEFTKTIPTVIPTSTQLSSKLYHNSKQISKQVYETLKKSNAANETTQDLAKKLYDGYDMNDKEVLDIVDDLPKYIKDYIKKPKNKKDLLKQIDKLKTRPYKSALAQLVNDMDDMTTEAMEKYMQVILEERARYYAYRLAFNEKQRSKSLALAKSLLRDQGVEYVQHRLSSLHDIYDICDIYDKANPTGLGPGVYHKNDMIGLPHHPFCRCAYSATYRTHNKGKKITDREYIEALPRDKQKEALGSWDKVDQFNNGKSPQAIWNSSRSEAYKIKKAKDILDSTRKV